MAKISVIVPVYNVEDYLETCVRSIQNSTYQDWECVLVDDGSTDQSSELCDKFEKEDERIRTIHKNNGGLTSARVVGFAATSAEYVCFVDSDDYIADNMFERLLQIIEQEEADVVVCSHYQDVEGELKEDTFTYTKKIVNQDELMDDYVLPIIGKIYAPGYVNYPGYVWGRLYRRSCVSNQCFVSEREVYTEDDLFQMYLSENIHKVVFTNEKLCYYRVNPNSLTHVYRRNMWCMLKKRHNRVLEFLEKHGREQEKARIQGSAFYSIYVAVTNAYNRTHYGVYRNEVEEIREDEFTSELISKMDLKLLRPRQKLFYTLFDFRCYFLLYHFRTLMFR